MALTPRSLGGFWEWTAQHRPCPPSGAPIPSFTCELAAALRGEGPLPVDPAGPLEVLKIIEGIHALA